MTGYVFENDEGKRAMMVNGDHEEPITGWVEVLDLIRGKRYYRHEDGRELEAV